MSTGCFLFFLAAELYHMKKKWEKTDQKQGGVTLKDIGSYTNFSFFLHATLKRPQKKKKKNPVLILHGIFSKFNLWLLDPKYNLQENSQVLVCI